MFNGSFLEELLTIVSPQSIENNQTDFWGDTTHSWHRPIIYQIANNISAVKKLLLSSWGLSRCYVFVFIDRHALRKMSFVVWIRQELLIAKRLFLLKNIILNKIKIGKTLESSVLQSRMLPVNLPTDVFDYDVSGLFAETMKSNKIKVPMIVDDVELDIKYKYVLVNETPKTFSITFKIGLCTRKRCYRDASCWIQRGMHRNNKKKKFCATSCF